MQPARFTVLLCVHRLPELLPFAIKSVLWQSHGNFELFVVCDGAPAAAACARLLAADDPRIRVFDFEKGERNGERHRHAVLAEATGDLVAHLGYDDLWFPDHLKEIAALLAEVEFGHLAMMAMAPDGSPLYFRDGLGDVSARQRMLSEKWNCFGPTVAGYRLSTYRRLPEGWAPAPPEIWSDLHMWRKFLALEGISVGSRSSIQALCLHNSLRREMTPAQRLQETTRWAQVVSDPVRRAALIRRYRIGRALHGIAGLLPERLREAVRLTLPSFD